jgi:SAM-dependent methyltransferase
VAERVAVGPPTLDRDRVCSPHVWGDTRGGHLMQCTVCGLVATSRVPRYEYEANYFTDPTKGGYDFAADFSLDFDLARFESELERLARGRLRGSLLDIGCATGTYMEAAQARGWRVTGVETAEYGRAETARRTSALVVAACEELPAGQTFDLVTLHHVLEHVHEPLAFLRDTVAPRVGGRLLIEVPNFDSLASRVYGTAWRDLRLEQHVCHYTSASLSRLVTAAGLRVRRTYTLWQPLWSLRANAELLRLTAGGLRGVDRRWETGATDAISSEALERANAYRRPHGAKRAVVGATRLATRPLVSALERLGYGDRLVVEAEPGERGTASSGSGRR